jgi:hypothetical protein
VEGERLQTYVQTLCIEFVRLASIDFLRFGKSLA